MEDEATFMGSAMDLGGMSPILSAITEGILLADAQRRVTYVNQGFTAITGYESGDLLGHSCAIVQGPDTSPETILAMRTLLDAGQPFSGEVLNYTKAGAPFWNDLTITPLFDQGALSGYVGITRDRSARKDAEHAQASRERLYTFLFEHVQAGIVLHRANTEIIYINAMASELLGITEEKIIGAGSDDACFEFIREDGSTMPPEEFPAVRALATRRVVKSLIVGQRRRSDGRLIWAVCNAYPNLDASGEPTEVVVSFTEVTELKQTEQALKKSEERLSLVLRGANDAAWDWDIVANELYCSPRWWQMIGYPPDEPPTDSQLWRRITHPDDIEQVQDTLQRMLDGATTSYELEFRLQHKRGTYIPVLSRGFILRDASGRPMRVSGTNTDLTERKRWESQVHRLAYYDALTGLPNRRMLMERLGTIVATPPGEREQGALLFIDLDNFKLLNDTLGHEIGDQLLQQVSERLHACVSSGNVLVRLGSDEFVALLEHLGDRPDIALREAGELARTIGEVLSVPFTLRNIEHRCTASIGIALLDAEGGGADTTLKHADLAMHQAKAAGRNTQRVFDRSMQVTVNHRLELENDLRSDMLADRLLLHFQPQVNGDGRVVGAEALLRWPHRTRGMIPPDQFIPIAEATSIIVPLGEWVLERACDQLNAWAADPKLARLSLSVNASVRQLHAPDFVQRVLDILQRTGVDPTRLKIEVTESLFAENIEDVIAKMARLRETGLRFSLDDFGIGYSSLSYLQRMPLDEIKIDRSFIVDVPASEQASTIARMIISLADSLGITVLAEGVETEAQRAFLLRHGCGNFQGHLYSAAVPLDEFEALIG